MKTFLFTSISVICSILVFSCGAKSSNNENSQASDNKEIEKSKICGYYLHAGKVYFHNFTDNSAEALNITEKPILEFYLSPKQDYIVFIKETSRNDCSSFSSLGIYDLSQKIVIKELAKEKYSNVYFQKWESDKSFSFVEAISPDQYDHGMDELERFSWTHTIGGGRDATIMSETDYADGHFWMQSEEKEGSSINPDISTSIQDNGIVLTNNKTGDTKTITVPDDDVMSYHVNAWLDSDRFLFTVKHHSKAQCDVPVSDLCLYNLKTDSQELIKKDVSFLQLKTKS